MGGSGSGANTVFTNLIPDFAELAVEKYVKKAYQLADPKSDRYNLDNLENQDTYAEQNSNETDGIEALATRATEGSPVVDKAIDLLGDIFEGNKLNANTKSDSAYETNAEIIKQQLTEEILPDLESEALSLGMFGSSGHNIKQAKAAEIVLSKLIDASKGIYFDNYETARDIQENALGHGVVYGSESIRNNELLRQAGLYKREYAQGALEDDYRKWTARQMHEITKLEILGNAIRATVGASVTRTEPFYRPKAISQIAGLALAGAGLFATFYKGTTPTTSQYNSAGTYTPYVPGGEVKGIGMFNPSASDLGIGNMPGSGGK